MAVPAQPHDALFRALTESPQRADRLVRDALPPALAELLSDAPARLLPGTFVARRLRAVQADRLLEFASERLLPAEDPLLNTCVEYLETVIDAVGGEAAGVSPEDEPRTKEYLMATLVERLVQKGRAEGKAETLLRQLVLRFGAVPDGVKARVRAAVGGDLDAWLDAILEAPDLEAVFVSRSVK